MHRRLEASLLTLVMASISGTLLAQQPGGAVRLQRGVSVQMPVTTNAVAVPNAD